MDEFPQKCNICIAELQSNHCSTQQHWINTSIYLTVWENCQKIAIIINAVLFDDASGAEMTHFSFHSTYTEDNSQTDNTHEDVVRETFPFYKK